MERSGEQNEPNRAPSVDAVDALPGAGTPVVLYVSTTQYGDAAGTMLGLRDYAVARAWRIVAEYVDRCGPQVEEFRPGFRAAKAAIGRRDAQLFVTRYPTMAAGLDSERAELEQWLADRGAALHTTWVSSLNDPGPAGVSCHYCSRSVEFGAAALVGDIGGRRIHACAVCMVSQRLIRLDEHPEGSDGRPRYRDRAPQGVRP